MLGIGNSALRLILVYFSLLSVQTVSPAFIRCYSQMFFSIPGCMTVSIHLFLLLTQCTFKRVSHTFWKTTQSKKKDHFILQPSE